MIDLLLEHENEAALVRALVAHEEDVRRSARRGEIGLVREAERAVAADPGGAFRFDASGDATLTVGRRSWAAGRFEPTSIGELRGRVRGPSRVRLWVIDGGSAATDIGSLQAWSGGGTLFQVASQFNCLESPGPFVTTVERYLNDPTQGPRASISALPGTLLRHYAAPGPDGRFVQSSDARQVELLGAICEPGLATVRNGYLLADEITDPTRLRATLEARFHDVRVGVHEGVEVVLGHDWSGAVGRSPAPRIAQVFTSTVAGGGYGTLTGPLVEVCRQLLRAAYLGTLLAAASLGRSRVVLTMIGGGVFGNPTALIWESIVWAVDEAAAIAGRDLDVVVNGRGLARQLDLREVAMDTNDRWGFVLSWPSGAPPRVPR